MQENFFIEKLDKTDTLSTFLAYHDSLSCCYDVGLEENATPEELFSRYQKIEDGLVSAQEYLTKAETYIKIIDLYSERPENFVDLTNYPQQITYKDMGPLVEGFSNFIEDLYKSYDNFYRFFIGNLFMFIDKDKTHQVYLKNKPKSKKMPDDIFNQKEKFYSLLANVNKEIFDSHFVEVTNIYFDINEKRNAINHHGKTKSDLQRGHYAVIVNEKTKEISLKSFPFVSFHNEKLTLDVYCRYVFYKIFYSMQNLYVACVNTLLQRRVTPIMPVMRPQFYPIESLSKDLIASLRKRGKIHSDKQLYIFGLIDEKNKFINYSCGLPQNPKFIKNRQG